MQAPVTRDKALHAIQQLKGHEQAQLKHKPRAGLLVTTAATPVHSACTMLVG